MVDFCKSDKMIEINEEMDKPSTDNRVNILYLIRNKWPSQLGMQNIPTALLKRGKTPTNECPEFETKQSDGELWGMLSTPLLLLLPGQH